MTAVLFAPQIEDDATRRQFLIGGLSVAALLTGCGGVLEELTAAVTAADPAVV